MLTDKLSSDFIIELFAYALNKRSTFDVVRTYLKFSYLQNESEKKLWQWITRQFDKTGRIPTIGQIQQQFIKN